MLVKTYDQTGKEVGQTRLPSEIFDVKVNADLLHQIVVSQTSNRRQVIAHTKDRSEVRGGGKKPWRQKGTGRARHGSIRSPLWNGGGVTFGPRNERNFKKILPKKMRRKALFMVLSEKARNNTLLVLDKLSIDTPKTKVADQILNNLRKQVSVFKKGKVLIGLPNLDKNIILSVRNLEGVKPAQVKDFNALDLLSFKYVILPKESIKVLKETFLGDKAEEKELEE